MLAVVSVFVTIIEQSDVLRTALNDTSVTIVAVAVTSVTVDGGDDENADEPTRYQSLATRAIATL